MKYVVDRLSRVTNNIVAKLGFVGGVNLSHFIASRARVMSIMLTSSCLSHWWEKVEPSEAENDVSIMWGVVLWGKLMEHVNGLEK